MPAVTKIHPKYSKRFLFFHLNAQEKNVFLNILFVWDFLFTHPLYYSEVIPADRSININFA